MSIWKTLGACALAGTLMIGQLQQASAAPMPTNVGAMKAMIPDTTTEVRWRGGGVGFGIGALAAGAIIGGAIASSGPYGYYGGPYYGYPGPYYGYGYAPAYYGYGPYYGYAPYYGYRRHYYRPYGYYPRYRYGYYRPYRVYPRYYHRHYW